MESVGFSYELHVLQRRRKYDHSGLADSQRACKKATYGTISTKLLFAS